MKTRKPLKANPAVTRAWQDRSRKPLARGEFWKTKTGQLRRKTAMKQRNEKNIAKRRATYTKYLASAEWLQLRYARFLMDEGMCQCRWCVAARKGEKIERPDGVLVAEAFVPIPVYYVSQGTAPWRRIRGFSTHHTHYDLTNQKLKDIRTTYPHHHAAEESLHGTRRRYLRIGK